MLNRERQSQTASMARVIQRLSPNKNNGAADKNIIFPSMDAHPPPPPPPPPPSECAVQDDPTLDVKAVAQGIMVRIFFLKKIRKCFCHVCEKTSSNL